MRPAAVEGAFSVDFRDAGAPARGYRLHALPCGGGEVWLGRAPSVRRMGQGPRGDMRRAYDFWMPLMLLRRTGPAPLTSVYTSVHEPWSGSSFVSATQAAPLTPDGGMAVALEVRHGRTVDTILSTDDITPYPERRTETGIRLRGRFAVVRRTEGRISGMWLWDGEELVCGDVRLASRTPAFEGALTGATRRADGHPEDALLTNTPLPEGESLRGRWLVVTYPNGMTQGHELGRVEARDGLTCLVTRMDHGLRVKDDRVEEVYAPMRKMEGRCRFRLPGMARWIPQG